MRKNYIVPQTEAMQFGSSLMQDSMSIIHHSGGGGNQGSGFDDEHTIA